MPSDHEVALAFIARRQAARAMSATRWCHLLSLEMGWMNPGQARSFVEAAVRAGLLAPDGDTLRLVIDPQAVEVPRGFRPRSGGTAAAGTPQSVPQAAATVAAPSSPPAPPSGPPSPAPQAATAPQPSREPDLFLAWVAKLAAHRRGTREQVLDQVASAQAAMGGLLTAEAAVLLLARRSGLDVAEVAGKAAEAMLTPSRRGAAAPAPAGSP